MEAAREPAETLVTQKQNQNLRADGGDPADGPAGQPLEEEANSTSRAANSRAEGCASDKGRKKYGC